MAYYDDEDDAAYNGYRHYPEYEEETPVGLTSEACTKVEISEELSNAGLIPDTEIKYAGSMDKLIFVYGNPDEIYSPAEIKFTEHVTNTFVYNDFLKKLRDDEMVCRTIAAIISSSGDEAVKACISFEKIVDKALDGFNIFLFITEESVFFGCRVFGKSNGRDCVLSNPIKTEEQLEQINYELLCVSDEAYFMKYALQIINIITGSQDQEEYEISLRNRRRRRSSYYQDIDRDDWLYMDNDASLPFTELLKEVEDELAFIKSNRINTYEMLYEANKSLEQAEAVEAQNARLSQQGTSDANSSNVAKDEEAKALLDNPDEVIKLLKKRRGI